MRLPSGCELRPMTRVPDPKLLADFERRLTPEDRAELAALDYDATRSIVESAVRSEVSFWLIINGQVACALGVVRKSEKAGRFWLLTTTTVKRNRKQFLGAAKFIVPALHSVYPVLENELGISLDHKPALRLAEHMGFQLLPVREVRPGVRFVPFRSEVH